MSQPQEKHTRLQVAQAVKAVESKKGEDVAILEMDRASGAFTDYFIVCSGTNPRQIQAISDEVEKELGHAGLRPNSVEGYNQAEWVLLDYVDFVVHIFSERARSFYDLERLWKSARRLRPADLARKPLAKKATARSAGTRKPPHASKAHTKAKRRPGKS
ncbi:MAG TPA: ribosome silencing factor [Candidatus Angelobacter sp.]|jgi:ribosome-associated protein|nr:ribosome silencing factor [Candidatus Angelobacter sp.]